MSATQTLDRIKTIKSKKIFKVLVLLSVSLVIGFIILFTESFYGSEKLVSDVEAKYLSTEVNALTAYYHQAGDPNNPKLLFLHGWGGNYSNDSLRQIVQGFAEHGYFAIAIEMPGMGRSETPTMPWSNEDYANFVHSFSKVLDLDKYVLVGQSFGGGVAAIVAEKYPEFVEKLVLVDAAAGDRTKPREIIINAFGNGFYSLMNSRYFSKEGKIALAEYMFFTPRETIVGDSLNQRVQIMTTTFLQTHTEQMLDRLGKIQVPTLLVWGTLDLKQPLSRAKKMQAKLQNSKLVTLYGGHTILYKQPEKTIQLIISNLD